MLPQILMQVLGATAVQFLVNTGLVAVMVVLGRGGRLREVWKAQFGRLLSGHVAFAVLGVVLAALHFQLKYAAAIFLLVPLLVARNAFTSAIEMEGAFEATVR